ASPPARMRRSEEADCLPRGADLQFLRLALRQPDRSGMGGRSRARRHRPAGAPRWPGPCPELHRTLGDRMPTTAHHGNGNGAANGNGAPDLLIDCKIHELFYGQFKAVADTDVQMKKG